MAEIKRYQYQTQKENGWNDEKGFDSCFDNKHAFYDECMYEEG